MNSRLSNFAKPDLGAKFSKTLLYKCSILTALFPILSGALLAEDSVSPDKGISGTVLIVDSEFDDGDGDNTTLREAIEFANSDPETFNLIRIGVNEITLLEPLPAIDGSLTILGDGNFSFKDGSPEKGFFTPQVQLIADGFPIMSIASGDVRMENLSLVDGYARGGDGSVGTSGAPGGGGAGMGGGLFMLDGDVFLRNVSFVNCTAEGGLGIFASVPIDFPPDQQIGGGGGGTAGSGLSDGTGGDGGRGPGSQMGGLPDCNSDPTPIEAGGAGGLGNCDDIQNRNGRDGSFGGGGGGGAGIGGSGGNGSYGAGAGAGVANQDGIDGIPGEFGGSATSDLHTLVSGAGAGLGGSIFALGGTLELDLCEFIDSSALGGQDQLTSDTTARGKGGAIFVHPNATVRAKFIDMVFTGINVRDTEMPIILKEPYDANFFSDTIEVYGVIEEYRPPLRVVLNTDDNLLIAKQSAVPELLNLRTAMFLSERFSFDGPDVIEIDEFVSEIILLEALPFITESLEIRVLPNNLPLDESRLVTLKGNDTFPILTVTEPAPTFKGTTVETIEVTLTDLEIRDGLAEGGDGGDGVFHLVANNISEGIAATFPGGAGAGLGGGLFINNDAALVNLIRCDIVSCEAQGGLGGQMFVRPSTSPTESDRPVGAGGGGSANEPFAFIPKGGFGLLDTNASSSEEITTDNSFGGTDRRFNIFGKWTVNCFGISTPDGAGGFGYDLFCPDNNPNIPQGGVFGGFGGGGGAGILLDVGTVDIRTTAGDGGYGGGGGSGGIGIDFGDGPIEATPGFGGVFGGHGWFEIQSATVQGRGGGGGGLGGGVFLRRGTLRMNEVNIESNRAEGGNGGIPGFAGGSPENGEGEGIGGGIFAMNFNDGTHDGAGQVFGNNVTFNGNTAFQAGVQDNNVFFGANDNQAMFGVFSQDPASPVANFEVLSTNVFSVNPIVTNNTVTVRVSFSRGDGEAVDIVDANVDLDDFRLITPVTRKGFAADPFLLSITPIGNEEFDIEIAPGLGGDDFPFRFTSVQLAMRPGHDIIATDNRVRVADNSRPSESINFDIASASIFKVTEPFEPTCSSQNPLVYIFEYDEGVTGFDVADFNATFTPTGGSPVSKNADITITKNPLQFTNSNGQNYTFEYTVMIPFAQTDFGNFSMTFTDDTIDQAGNPSTGGVLNFNVQKTVSVATVGTLQVDLGSGQFENVGGSGCANIEVPFNLVGRTALLDSVSDFSDSVFELVADENDSNSRVEFRSDLISCFEVKLSAKTSTGSFVLYEGDFTIDPTTDEIVLSNSRTNSGPARLPWNVTRLFYNRESRLLSFSGFLENANLDGVVFRGLSFKRATGLDVSSVILEAGDAAPLDETGKDIRFNLSEFILTDTDSDNKIQLTASIDGATHPEFSSNNLSFSFKVDNFGSGAKQFDISGTFTGGGRTIPISKATFSTTGIALEGSVSSDGTPIKLVQDLHTAGQFDAQGTLTPFTASFVLGGREFNSDNPVDEPVTFASQNSLNLGRVKVLLNNGFGSLVIEDTVADISPSGSTGIKSGSSGSSSIIILGGIAFAAGEGTFSSSGYTMTDGLSFPPGINQGSLPGNLSAAVPGIQFEPEDGESTPDLAFKTSGSPEISLNGAEFNLLTLPVQLDTFEVSEGEGGVDIEFDGGISLPDNLSGAAMSIGGIIEANNGNPEFNLQSFSFQTPSTPIGVEAEFKIKKTTFGLPTLGFELNVPNKTAVGSAHIEIVDIFTLDIIKLGFRLVDNPTLLLLDALIVQVELPKAIPIGSTGIGLLAFKGGVENLVRTPRNYEISYLDFSTGRAVEKTLEQFGIAPTRVIAGLTAIGGPDIPILGPLLAVEVEGSVDETQIAVKGSATLVSLIETGGGYAHITWSGPRTGTGFGGYFTHFIIRVMVDAFIGFAPSSFNVCADISIRIPEAIPIVGGMSLGSIYGCIGANPFKITGCIDLFFFDACFTINAGNIKSLPEKEKGQEWRRSINEPVPMYAFNNVKTGEPSVLTFQAFTNFYEHEVINKSAGVTDAKGGGSIFNIQSLTTGPGVIRLNHELTTDQGGNPTFTVQTPSGEILTTDLNMLDPSFDPSSSAIGGYLANPGSNDASYLIGDLEVGTYIVTVDFPNTLGDFDVSLSSQTPEPEFEFTGVTLINNELILEWDDNDPADTTYLFFLGTDNELGTGQEITNPEFPIDASDPDNFLVVDLNSVVGQGDGFDDLFTPEEFDAAVEAGARLTTDPAIIILGAGDFYPFVQITQNAPEPKSNNEKGVGFQADPSVLRRDVVVASIPISLPGPDADIIIENFDVFSTGDGFVAIWDLPQGELPDSNLKLIWTDRPELNVYEFGQSVPAGETSALVQTERFNRNDPELTGDPVVVDEIFKAGEQYKIALSAMQYKEFDIIKRTRNFELISDAARKVMSQKSTSRSHRAAIAADALRSISEEKSFKLSDDEVTYLSREASRLSESIENNIRYYGKSDKELIAKAANASDKNRISTKGAPLFFGNVYVETIIAGPEVIVLAYPGNRNTPPRFVTEPVAYVQAGDLYESLSVAVDFNTTDTITYEIDFGPDDMTIDENGMIQWQTSADDILTEQEFGTEPDANLIRVKANDGQGGIALQEYHLEVGQLFPSRNVEIFTTPPSDVMPAETYEYQIGVLGAGNSDVVWELIEAPAGMFIQPEAFTNELNGDFASIIWETSPTEEIGSYRVIARATTTINGKDITDQQEFFVNVEDSNDVLTEFIDKAIDSLFDFWLFR